jgi:hypothetical protein
MAIGNEQFKQEIEALTGRRMKDKKTGQKMGRPASLKKRSSVLLTPVLQIKHRHEKN